MFDIGWSEMAVIMMVALIVIGPKDLPRLARQIGKWTAKARGMAREFQRSLDDMAREAELQDIKAEMEKLSRTDVRQRIEDTIDPDGAMRRSLAPPFDDPKPRDEPDGEMAAESPEEAPLPAPSTTATPVAVPSVTTALPAPVDVAPTPIAPPAENRKPAVPVSEQS